MLICVCQKSVSLCVADVSVCVRDRFVYECLTSVHRNGTGVSMCHSVPICVTGVLICMSGGSMYLSGRSMYLSGGSSIPFRWVNVRVICHVAHINRVNYSIIQFYYERL